MEYEVLLSKLLRLPIKNAMKEYEKFNKKHKLNFGDAMRASNFLMQKVMTKKRITDEPFLKAMTTLYFLSMRKNKLNDIFLEEVKSYPMIIWMETIGELNCEQIEGVLKNYGEKLPSALIETLIINLPEEKQQNAIKKYNRNLDSKNEHFYSFYHCLSKEAQEEIDRISPNAVYTNPLLKLKELTIEEVKEELINNKNMYQKVSMDDIIEAILLTTNSSEDIIQILDAYKERDQEISDMRFELLIGRLKLLLAEESYGNNRHDRYLKIFNIFKTRFKKIGLINTLSILDANINGYYQDNHGTEIIYEFLDIAYKDEKLAPFINQFTINNLIEKVIKKCEEKEYTTEEFKQLVEKTKVDETQKLIYDDYIEAMIACGQLMKKNIISNTNEHFLELRKKFINILNNKLIKDGTCTEEVNLNSLFYRLIKGNLSFSQILNTKTYKGLIYLTKAYEVHNNPDDITQYLSDEQLKKLDIKPLLKFKKENPNLQQHKERMFLQLLCCFGEIPAKHIVTSDMQHNRMENVFDNINYKDIKIDEFGKPIINQGLNDFLFGRGSVKEENTIMNQIIREDLVDFGRYIPELYNNYERIKEDCYGVLTVKRICSLFNDIELPIELKPNQYKYKRPLREMNTTNESLLNKAISLCDNAQTRKYSTIPKVKGNLGNFSYEILDVNDPFALAVGYLSHCCFTVGGESKSALEHSMQSKNGRTFVVYHKGKFLTQSWVWRNGDVVCFDSVEAGSRIHGAYEDDINIVDVYETVAKEIIDISSHVELEKECIKVVTVGKSDYRFNKLKLLEGTPPTPLEKDVYVYDSREQKILAGKMPKNPNCQNVSVKYKDPRKKVYQILDVENSEIDDLDDAILKLQAIKYDATGNEEKEDITNINQLFVGDDWYIKTTKSGDIEVEILNDDQDAINECTSYAEILGINFESEYTKINQEYNLSKDEVVKQLRLTKLGNRRG